MTRRRAATEAELALWRHTMRDATPLRADVTPLVPALPPALAPAAPPPAPAPFPQPVIRPPAPPPRPRRLTPGGAHDLDGGGAERLRRGDWPIDGRLDLHGLTQDQAHAALARFLHQRQEQGARCVLVITGKGGRGAGTEGILRAAAPRWINEPPNRGRVLAIAQAQPRHGGDGAFYVLLKKLR